jgi:hypothetical protein
MYQRSQQAADQQEAMQFAQLTPFQQASAGFYSAGRGLGRGIGSMLGAEDPQLRMISARNQIAKSININDPSTFQSAMLQLQRLGDFEGQRQLQGVMDEALQRSAATESRQRTAATQNLITRSFQPAIPEQQQFVQVDETGQPVPIPARPASFNINPVLSQLMALGPEGRDAITQQAKLIPDLRRLGAASMREENPFSVFTTDPTIPKTVKTLADQYFKSFASGMLDPEKADARVKDLADMTQRVQQFDQNQAQIKSNQQILADLRAQGLENSRQGLLIQQGNQRLAEQNAVFQRDIKRAESDRKIEDARNKPLPSYLAKGEEADYDAAQAASNIAFDANNYINRIKSGEVKFGLKDKASIRARQLVGSSDPDVVAREDYDKFLRVLVNESLRLNKGTQTEGDSVRAAKELESSESPQAAASAMRRLVDINVRRVQDASKSVATRRQNANFPAAPRPIDVPVFEYQVIDNADYQRFVNNPKYPSGTPFIDPTGVRRTKP